MARRHHAGAVKQGGSFKGRQFTAEVAWFRIGHFWVTRAHEERRPVRAGLSTGMCPVREAASLPVVKPAGAEAVPGPAG